MFHVCVLCLYVYVYVVCVIMVLDVPYPGMYPGMRVCTLRLAFTRYCFTYSRLYLLHNNFFSKHPLYCAIYCTILPVIAPPAQF